MVAVASNATVKTVNHTIQDGETLYIIAKKHHTTISEVRKANGMKKGEILKIGKVLKVPQNTYFPDKKATQKKHKKSMRTVKYTVKKGDVLSTIALRYNTSVKALQKLNGLKQSEIIRVGEVLKVPASKYHYAKKRASQRTCNKYSKNSISNRVRRIISLAKKKLGRKYVWGAVGQRNTFDCSGLTKYVYQKNGINIPRTSIKQAKYGKYVPRKNLKPGDLVFFDTSKRRKGYVNHVGIYIGNNKFLHASSAKKKVVITSLNKPFYKSRYKGARRPS